MAIRPRATIKSWFYRGAKPLASMFHDWMDSYYHKDEDKAYVALRQYSTTTEYESGMTCVKDGSIWQANQATTGTWNPSAWDIVGASTSYTNAEATPQTLGGIPAGSTFSMKTMTEMWDALLYPYQPPAFTMFAMSGMAATYEVGSGIDADDYTWNWVTSNPDNVQLNSIGISGLGFTALTGLPDSGAQVITMSDVKLLTSGTGTWTIVGTNTNSAVFTSNVTASWRWRMYWGTSSNATLTEAQVKALAGSALASGYSSVRSFAAAPLQYKYVAYPVSFGTATHFTDQSTMLAVPFEAPFVVSITNSFGVTTNYNVHRSTNLLGGAISIIIAS